MTKGAINRAGKNRRLLIVRRAFSGGASGFDHRRSLSPDGSVSGNQMLFNLPVWSPRSVSTMRQTRPVRATSQILPANVADDKHVQPVRTSQMIVRAPVVVN